MSFEILKREENLILSKSDIWSLGNIIYYLLFKEYPYNYGKYNIIKQNEENIILKNLLIKN
jgi:serine/threonine protein kinase